MKSSGIWFICNSKKEYEYVEIHNFVTRVEKRQKRRQRTILGANPIQLSLAHEYMPTTCSVGGTSNIF